MEQHPKPGDPEYKAFVRVAQWNNAVVCLPTWEEFRELEYIRCRGEINMISENVQRWAYDHGLYSCVNWLQRCKEGRVSHITWYSELVKHFEELHGPRAGWITDEVKVKIELSELEHQEHELEMRRLDLVRRRKMASNKQSTSEKINNDQ